MNTYIKKINFVTCKFVCNSSCDYGIWNEVKTLSKTNSIFLSDCVVCINLYAKVVFYSGRSAASISCNFRLVFVVNDAFFFRHWIKNKLPEIQWKKLDTDFLIKKLYCVVRTECLCAPSDKRRTNWVRGREKCKNRGCNSIFLVYKRGMNDF